MVGSVPWDVNYLAMLAATVVGMIIGAVYYNPKVVGKAWMAATERTEEQLKANVGVMMWVVTVAVTLLLASLLGAAVNWAGQTTLGGGATVGFLLWLGVTLPVVTMTFLFEGRSYNAIAITLGHQLLVMVAMGAMIGWFPWGGM